MSSSGPHPSHIRMVSEAADGQISLDLFTGFINIGTLVFLLQGLSIVNTWSQLGMFWTMLAAAFCWGVRHNELLTSCGGANAVIVFIMSPEKMSFLWWSAVVWKTINMAIIWTP